MENWCWRALVWMSALFTPILGRRRADDKDDQMRTICLVCRLQANCGSLFPMTLEHAHTTISRKIEQHKWHSRLLSSGVCPAGCGVAIIVTLSASSSDFCNRQMHFTSINGHRRAAFVWLLEWFRAMQNSEMLHREAQRTAHNIETVATAAVVPLCMVNLYKIN